MAAKAKAITLYYPYIPFLGLVKRKVYFRIKSRIIGKVVNSWRNNAII